MLHCLLKLYSGSKFRSLGEGEHPSLSKSLIKTKTCLKFDQIKWVDTLSNWSVWTNSSDHHLCNENEKDCSCLIPRISLFLLTQAMLSSGCFPVLPACVGRHSVLALESFWCLSSVHSFHWMRRKTHRLSHWLLGSFWGPAHLQWAWVTSSASQSDGVAVGAEQVFAQRRLLSGDTHFESDRP